MPIELKEEENGRILEVRLIGTLVKEDYKPLAKEFVQLAEAYGKIRVLLDMIDFHGWDAGALWQEVKFDIKHLDKMERLAVVGETRWQRAIASFSKPFTTAEVRYFDAAQRTQAREWLARG